MNKKIEISKLIFRKLKITDFSEFRKLFYHCFNRKVSFDFFRSRYFSDKSSFCYGVFHSSKLVANVGMVSLKLNNTINERIFSRHSSMVLKKYRGKNIFSNLLKKVRKNISKNIKIIIMWPNKNNFSNFAIDKKNIININLYIYKTSLNQKSFYRTKNYEINELNKLRPFIKNKNSFFLKNYSYFKRRYLSYNSNDYFINKFQSKSHTSFFIIKRNKDKSEKNYVILDHFGDEKLQSTHMSRLVQDYNKLIFISKKKN